MAIGQWVESIRGIIEVVHQKNENARAVGLERFNDSSVGMGTMKGAT